MKKVLKLLVITFILATGNKAVSQNVIFDEKFENNDNNWATTSESGVYRHISPGRYVWEGTSSQTSAHWEFVSVSLDQDRDFMIEATVKKVSGPESGWGFGILWGNISNRFTVYGSKGSYSIVGDIYSQTSSSYIHTGNSQNELKVKKTGSYLEFYVNGQYLNRAAFQKFSDSKIGFYLYMDDVKLEVNNLTITYLGSSTTTSSKKMIFSDDFSDNSNGWIEGSSDEYYSKISNGKLIFENKGSDNSYNIWVPLDLDGSSDFTIETAIQKNFGVDNSPYGLTFGLQDVNNKYDFMITSDGTYCLVKWDDGTSEYLINSTESSLINKGTYVSNRLKIVHTGSYLNLYINGTYVNRYYLPTLAGSKMGFVINRDQRMEVDYLYVYNSSSNYEEPKKEEPRKIVTEEQDPSLLGDESRLVFDFLKVMRDERSDNSKMMKYISPRYLKMNNLNPADYQVNYYFISGFKIKKFDKDNGVVQSVIWGAEGTTWTYQLNFKVVREDGRLYLYPSKFSDTKYIYPWIEVIENAER